MTTIADPAATPGTAAPRAAWHSGIGISIFGAALLAVLITVAVTTGGRYHQPIMDFARAVAITLIVAGLVVAGAAWNVRLRQREAATRATVQEEYELWHAQQYRALYEQHQQTREAVDAVRAEAAADRNAMRADMKELGRVMLRAGGQRGIDDLMTMVGQLNDRLTTVLMKRADSEAVERQILQRLDHIEGSVAAAASPNVLDLGAARDLRTIQQRFDDDADRG